MAIAVAFLPMMLIGAALTLSSGRIEDRFGRRRIITVGIPLRPPGWSRSGTPAWMLAALMLPVELLPPIGCDQELAEFGHPTLMRRVRSPRIRSRMIMQVSSRL